MNNTSTQVPQVRDTRPGALAVLRAVAVVSVRPVWRWLTWADDAEDATGLGVLGAVIGVVPAFLAFMQEVAPLKSPPVLVIAISALLGALSLFLLVPALIFHARSALRAFVAAVHEELHRRGHS